MTTLVLRLFLPDRPGALGAVASRIGSVGGDLVGIAILERGPDHAVDELVVELPGEELVELLVGEILEVDGVSVEQVDEAAVAARDPRIDALETAASLVGAREPEEALRALCERSVATVGATWGSVVRLDEQTGAASIGEAPDPGVLVDLVRGRQAAARMGLVEEHAGERRDRVEVAWAPMASARMALVLGRKGMPFRALERRQVAALARIVDTRFRELSTARARAEHPSSSSRPVS